MTGCWWKTAAAVVTAFVSAGCVLGPGQTDEGSDIVSQLKISIPKSATDIIGNTDRGIQFMLPNDQWPGYVDEYYPGATLQQFPAREMDGSAPLECLPALRSGTKLVVWSTGADIQFADTDKHAFRSVSVTPDCISGKTLVQWQLGDLE